MNRFHGARLGRRKLPFPIGVTDPPIQGAVQGDGMAPRAEQASFTIVRARMCGHMPFPLSYAAPWPPRRPPSRGLSLDPTLRRLEPA